MKKMAITNTHLTIAQRIIAFVQEQGWDVDGIEIYRYDPQENPFSANESGEDWKSRKIKWGLRLSVGPRNDDELVPKKQTVIE